MISRKVIWGSGCLWGLRSRWRPEYFLDFFITHPILHLANPSFTQISIVNPYEEFLFGCGKLSAGFWWLYFTIHKAALICPSLKEKTITPHTFRHSTAMNLLQAGVDISTIAIWMGHESIETTHKYMVADIEIKRKAMEKISETENTSFHYKPSKSILDFLSKL